MNDELRDICELLDWSIHEDDGYVELEKYSPAGEDFLFSVKADDFVEEVKWYAANFDQDEHIAMWIEAAQNGARGVPSPKELVQDAEDIDKMLQELASTLSGGKVLKHNGAGVCPACGSKNLVYGDSGPRDDSYFYSWECEDCGARGKEWYDLVFSENIVEMEGE